LTTAVCFSLNGIFGCHLKKEQLKNDKGSLLKNSQDWSRLVKKLFFER
jgi:hypothetical protein